MNKPSKCSSCTILWKKNLNIFLATNKLFSNIARKCERLFFYSYTYLEPLLAIQYITRNSSRSENACITVNNNHE